MQMPTVACKEWNRRRRVVAIGSSSNPFHLQGTELKNVRLRFAEDAPVYVDSTCVFENVDVVSGRLVTDGTQWRAKPFDGSDVYNVNALGTFQDEICEWIIVNNKTFYRTVIDCNDLYISFVNCNFVECILLNCVNVDRSQCNEWTVTAYRRKHDSYPVDADGRVGFYVDYSVSDDQPKLVHGWFRMEDASLARRTLTRSVSSFSGLSSSFRLLLQSHLDRAPQKVAQPQPTVLHDDVHKRVSGGNAGGRGGGDGGGGGSGERQEDGDAKPALPPRKRTQARPEAMGDGEDAADGVHPV